MANKTGDRFSSRLTLIALGLMILVGAIIVYLDRNQIEELSGKAKWGYLSFAIILVAMSYFLQSLSFLIMWRVFNVSLSQSYLLRIGLVSSVLSNLIALPAALALQILVLGKQGVDRNQILGSSLLISYLKNLVFYSLIPLSLVYVIFTYPLFFGGVVTMVFIIIALSAAITVATVITFNEKLRTLVFRIFAKIVHVLTRRHIDASLENFSEALTRGIAEIKHNRKMGFLLAGLVVGDVASMIAVLWFCFFSLSVLVHLGVLITSFNFGITLTVISLIPGDLGVQEASIAGILAIFGVPFSHGILVAILFRVLYYFVPFVFSLGFYLIILREIAQLKKA